MDAKGRVSVRGALALAVLSGVLVALAVAVWRVPMSGIDLYPAQCFAVLGNTVPCHTGQVALLQAAAAGLVDGVLMYVLVRRVPSRWLRAKGADAE